ncbi:hypothetical protein H0H87_009313, partial [Tephrocybe sp. NHM501043]
LKQNLFTMKYIIYHVSLCLWLSLLHKMYEDAMTAIHKSLLKTSVEKNLTYAIELMPEKGQ